MTRPAPQKSNGEVVDVVERIARDIQAGVLASGMWLKQLDLEGRYGCTRPAVRRALDMLAEKRLVQHVPNRGYHVFAPDDQKTREILDIRVILETGAADAIMAHASTTSVARLRHLAEQFETLIDNGTLLELYDVNLAFHHALLDQCGNAELVKLVDELRRRTSSAPATQWQTRAQLLLSASEHHGIVAAIEQHDSNGLRRVIAAHIIKTEAIVSKA